MNPLQRLVRRWLMSTSSATTSARRARTLSVMTDELTKLQGLNHDQTDVTLEALRKAGWQSDEEVAQTQTVQRALRIARGTGDVIVGPWTGEVGFELLYWIPFLNWLVEQGLDSKRLVVISRGGAAPWYRHLTTRYLDVLDLMTTDEFRERSLKASGSSTSRSGISTSSCSSVCARRTTCAARNISIRRRCSDCSSACCATAPAVTSSIRSRRSAGSRRWAADLTPGSRPCRPITSVAKFYFSKPFPDSPDNHAFVRDVLQRVSRDVPVVLLSTSVRIDDHHDFAGAGSSGIHVVDAHREPQRNLELQTRIIADARGFIGTYGGFSYLAPFYGVRSVSFFSRRDAFKAHHLELADRVFDRLLPGGFIAMDRHAVDLRDAGGPEWKRVNTAPSPVAAGAQA